ncbi:MAG: DNA cytosine methyltransferase [Eubacterium sp.]
MAKEIIGSLYSEASDKFGCGYMQGIYKTIKAEKHDLGVVEKMDVKVIGNLGGYDMANRVYDKYGLSPTIRTFQGGGLEPKIIDEPKCLNSKGGRKGIEGLQPSVQDRVYDSNGISTAITSSFMPSILENKQIVIGGEQKHQSVKKDGICTCLTSSMGRCGGYVPLLLSKYRIRKLTPLECWRLMGFSDEDFHKAEQVNSNSQLYKQAGNSIVKNVLMAIFGQMIEGKEDLKEKC